jgi:hypothetical protein
MANKRSWWRLIISDDDCVLNEADLDHIADCIKNGYTEGEICETEDIQCQE